MSTKEMDTYAPWMRDWEGAVGSGTARSSKPKRAACQKPWGIDPGGCARAFDQCQPAATLGNRGNRGCLTAFETQSRKRLSSTHNGQS